MVQKCFLRKRSRNQRWHRIKPFEIASGLVHRSWSRRCQRLMTDLGVEESFSKAANQMKEHHGIDLNPSTISRITLKHAKRAQQLMEEPLVGKKPDNPKSPLVVEMDGGMVPLVETAGAGDRRKNRRVFWAELKVGVIQRLGEVGWKYTCSFGNPDDLGNRMLALLERHLRWQGETDLHGVGDGAVWITEQMERLAGSRGKYLVDLFHLSEYLANAAAAWTKDVKKETHSLKNRVKRGQLEGVKRKLRKYSKIYPEHEGLQKCIQYIANRPGQFKYEEAIRKDLPIGSGKVESTHRHMIQKRLKKPGAWWRRDHAEQMANLRALRANGEWERLWQGQATCELDSLTA